MGKYTYNENEFFNIEPDKLKGGKPLTFDLFIYLPLNERIILIIKNTEAPDSPALERYKTKGLKFFYIRAEEREAYTAYLQENNPEALAEETAGLAEEVAAAQTEVPSLPDELPKQADDAAQAPPLPILEIQPEVLTAKEFIPDPKPEELVAGLLETAEEKKEKALEQGRQMVKQILKDAPESVKQIMESEKAEHATKVAIYSALFVMGLGEKDQWILQDIIIASLLHDIGFIVGSPEALRNPFTVKTPEQRLELERHVLDGVEFLKDLDYVPNARTLQLLEQHHEKFNGTGYPKKLDSFNINEMAQVIQFADLIDSICHGWYDGTPRNLNDALAVVASIEKKTTFPEYFNPDVYRKIKNWLTKGAGKDYMEAATSVVEDTKSKMTA